MKIRISKIDKVGNYRYLNISTEYPYLEIVNVIGIYPLVKKDNWILQL
jgi:hypothetical protein